MTRRTLLIVCMLGITLVAAPCLPARAAVQQSDIGFVNSPIWFSKSNFSAGDQVKIYTTVKNSSSAGLRGTIIFYANGAQIGASDFSLAAGASTVVSAQFTAQEGLQSYSAGIKNMSAVLDDGTSEPVADSGTQPLSLTVAPPAVPPEPPQSPVDSLTDTVLATLPDTNVVQKIADAASASSTGPIAAGLIDSTSTVTAALAHLEANNASNSLLRVPAHYAKVAFQAADSLLDKAISGLAHAAISIRLTDKKAQQKALGAGTSAVGASAVGQSAESDSALALVYAFLAKVLTFKTAIYAAALYLIYKIVTIGLRLARGS